MRQAPGSVNQGHSATADEAVKTLLNVQQGKLFSVPTCHRTSLALARQLTDGGNELVHVALRPRILLNESTRQCTCISGEDVLDKQTHGNSAECERVVECRTTRV